MSKTSAEVKNRYNAKAYDRINLVVKKGGKEQIATHAAQNGESLNGYINRLIKEDMHKSE